MMRRHAAAAWAIRGLGLAVGFAVVATLARGYDSTASWPPWQPTAPSAPNACQASTAAGLDQYWPPSTRRPVAEPGDGGDWGEISACRWRRAPSGQLGDPHRIYTELSVQVYRRDSTWYRAAVPGAVDAYRTHRPQTGASPLPLGDEAFVHTDTGVIEVGARRANVIVTVLAYWDVALLHKPGVAADVLAANAEQQVIQLVAGVLQQIQLS